MDRKVAKELLHIRGWLERADTIASQGKAAYLADDLLQEAGDSLMMKLGRQPSDWPNSARSHPMALIGHLPLQTETSSSISTMRSTAN